MTERRNLTGVYMNNVEVDGQRTTICIADAPEDVRLKWLEKLDRERLVFVANVLAKEIRLLGDTADIHGPMEEDNNT